MIVSEQQQENRMKKILTTALVLMTLGLMMISSSIVWAQGGEEFTVPLSDPAKRGKLKAHLNYGSITVKGTARKDVLVRYKNAEDEEEEPEEHEHDREANRNHNSNVNREHSKDGLRKIGGGGLDLEVTESSNLVKVTSDSWNTKINLEIEVPSGFDLDVHTYNDGDLMITNIQGALELTNFNGAITALNISGSVVATTYNDEIRVTFDKVTEGTPMSYSTYNGDIDITFPATLKATVKVKTEQGDIYSGFGVDFKSSGPVQKHDAKGGVYKVTIDEWKRGDINGGGPEITMRNYNGDIYLRKK